MPATGYVAWSVTAGEQPTAAKWNTLGGNDASFNSGSGINDNAILWRHLSTDIVPTGAIMSFAGTTTPSSAWLVCDGSAISRAQYAMLFSVIGTNYGVGDGSTTFNLPALGGAFLSGYLNGDSQFGNIGQTGGERNHTLTYDEMPVHSHGVNDPSHAHASNTSGQTVFTAGSTNHLTLSSGAQQVTWGNTVTSNSTTGIWLNNAGSGWAHNNLPPYVTVNFLIKI